jgi:hypothetical protein
MVESTEKIVQRFLQGVKDGTFLRKAEEFSRDPEAQPRVVEAFSHSPFEGLRIQTEQAEEKRDYYSLRSHDLEKELEQTRARLIGTTQRLELTEDRNSILERKICELEDILSEGRQRRLDARSREIQGHFELVEQLWAKAKTRDEKNTALAAMVVLMDEIDTLGDEVE